MQAIFSTIYDFFLFKCEAHLLQLKLVWGGPNEEETEERPNTQKHYWGYTNNRKLQNVPSGFFFCRFFPFVLLSRDRKSNHIGLLRSLRIHFKIHYS